MRLCSWRYQFPKDISEMLGYDTDLLSLNAMRPLWSKFLFAGGPWRGRLGASHVHGLRRARQRVGRLPQRRCWRVEPGAPPYDHQAPAVLQGPHQVHFFTPLAAHSSTLWRQQTLAGIPRMYSRDQRHTRKSCMLRRRQLSSQGHLGRWLGARVHRLSGGGRRCCPPALRYLKGRLSAGDGALAAAANTRCCSCSCSHDLALLVQRSQGPCVHANAPCGAVSCVCSILKQ